MVKEAAELLDDISNWYIRRNRRRFWKSENDSDKVSAYCTLYNVLLTYIKIMSPVIPFITEKIYQNLVRSIDSSNPESIHLNSFPKYNKSLEEHRLIDEIDSIKNIVSLARSARIKANIKIRQPLNNIMIFLRE